MWVHGFTGLLVMLNDCNECWGNAVADRYLGIGDATPHVHQYGVLVISFKGVHSDEHDIRYECTNILSDDINVDICWRLYLSRTQRGRMGTFPAPTNRGGCRGNVEFGRQYLVCVLGAIQRCPMDQNRLFPGGFSSIWQAALVLRANRQNLSRSSTCTKYRRIVVAALFAF